MPSPATPPAQSRPPAVSPEPATVRLLARLLAADYPGGDRLLDGIAFMDAVADAHGWPTSILGVQLWRRCLAWRAAQAGRLPAGGAAAEAEAWTTPDRLLRALLGGRQQADAA